MKTFALTLILLLFSVPLHAQTMDDMVRWQATKDAPELPNTPGPASTSTGVAQPVTLVWRSAGATLGYDVYFSCTTSSPPKVTTVSAPTYTPVAVPAATKCYWKIVAKNPKGTMTGPVWSFTTSAGTAPPPLTIACPSNVTLTAASGATSATATYPAPTTTGGTAPVLIGCVPTSGTAFPVGTTTVTCTTKDAAAVTASCTFTVTVSAAAISPSPIGTHMPSATQIVASDLAVWTLGAKNVAGFFMILRNGTHAGGAYGRAVLHCADGIWVNGDDTPEQYYHWNGSGYETPRPTDPCPAVPPGPGQLGYLAWDAHPTAAGFYVLQGTQSGVYASVMDVGNVTSYVPQNVTSGTVYYFVVQAYTVLPAGGRDVSGNSLEVAGVKP